MGGTTLAAASLGIARTPMSFVRFMRKWPRKPHSLSAIKSGPSLWTVD